MAGNERLISLLKAGFEPLNENDEIIANYVIDLLPSGINEINIINPNRDIKSTFQKATSSFRMYESEEVMQSLLYEKTHARYIETEIDHPYVFEVKFLTSENLMPLITLPRTVDYISDVYLAHEFHHVLKDTNPKESRMKYRFAEVITMFYELVRADNESIDLVKREILNRRIALLQFDLAEMRKSPSKYNDKLDKGLKYFNSFYYSLAMFRVYKENPKQVLTLVSRVLKQEISTLDLLYILDLYDNGMDFVVKEEMDEIKLALKNS